MHYHIVTNSNDSYKRAKGVVSKHKSRGYEEQYGCEEPLEVKEGILMEGL